MTYPTFSHFIESITGFHIPLPIQTFGLFIVLAFICGHHFIKKEFIRFENSGFFTTNIATDVSFILSSIFNYLLNGLLSFLVGYKLIYIITNYSDFSSNPQKVLLSGDGNIMIGFIFLILTILYIFFTNKKPAPNTLVKTSHLSWNFLFIAAISGLIGAKIFAIFEGDVQKLNPYYWNEYKDYIIHLKNVLFSFSGLTFYGGLIFGTIAVVIYGLIHNMNIARLADSFAPSLILAYGVGRLGCHFSGDGDWGIEANMSNKPIFFPDWLWGYTFPRNVIESGELIDGCQGKYCYELINPVYPTALYEALFCIAAFIFLWQIRKRITKPGVLFCLYLVINGIERFSIETIRITKTINELTGKSIMLIGELTQAQFIGIIIIFIGVIGAITISLIQIKKIHKNETIKE